MEIYIQYFLADIVIIQLIIAEGNIDIQCEKFPVFYKDSLVCIYGLLVVSTEEVDGSQTQLVIRYKIEIIIHNANEILI